MPLSCSFPTRLVRARTVVPSLLLLLVLVSVVAASPTAVAGLPKHAKLAVPDGLAQLGNVVPGKYIVQFTRPAAANVVAQRRERASPESLERAVKSQHESFGAYVNRNHIPVKVERRYVKLFNGVSAQIDSADDLKKVLDAPGVAKVFPVTEVAAPKPVAIRKLGLKDPVVPQFAHNLTNVHLVNKKYPDLTGKWVKVGVIDSGIDWKHPAFAIPGQKCETFKGPGCRVLYGWDFVGGSSAGQPSSPDADPMDCNGHGTHVAGIIGGYDDRIKGVAPEVVFGAYPKGDSSIIIDAMERAFQDGMSVVNLSLGDGLMSAGSPGAQAVDTLVNNGVHVIAAAGNAGTLGLSFVGSPSTASKALSIASFDNSHSVAYSAEATGSPIQYPVKFYYSLGSDGVVGRFKEDGKYSLIRSPNPPDAANDGCSPFPSNHFAGGIALVRQGTCSDTDKVVGAVRAGALGVFLYNDQANGINPFDPLDATKVGSVPVAFISRQHGEALWHASAQRKVELGIKAAFEPSSTAGAPSWFSSWGLDVNLRIRPDFGSPGHNMYSAYPNGGYAEASGTSMACPYVAGIVALEVQRNGASTGPDSTLDIARRLSLTARPAMMPDGTSVAESVAKTGAGLVDALAFFDNPVSVTPHKLELGDTPQWPNAPIKSRTLTIKNNGKEAVTYRLTHTPSRAVMGDNGRTLGQLVTLSNVYARVTFSVPTVTLQPGEEKQVTVNINANVPLLSKLPEPGHYIFSGFVTLQTADRKNNLNVPYAVMTGDFNTMPVMPQTGPLVPVLTNGLALHPDTASNAPTYNGSPIPEFSLDASDVSSVPVVRFGTVFPTRKFAITVHNATHPSPVGYLPPVARMMWDHMPRLVDPLTGKPAAVAFNRTVYVHPSTESETTMLPDGEYRLGLQYVRHTALVDRPDAPWVVAEWMSPKFRITRPKRNE